MFQQSKHVVIKYSKSIKRHQAQAIKSLLVSPTHGWKTARSMSGEMLGVNLSKVRFLLAGVNKPDLELISEDHAVLRTVHFVIQIQWPIDLNLNLSSMSLHTAGIRTLVGLCTESRCHPHILFASSVGTLGSYEQKNTLKHQIQ